MIKKTKWFMLFISLGSWQAAAASPHEHPFLASHAAHPKVAIPAPADFTQDSLQLRSWLEQTLAQDPPHIDYQAIVARMQQVPNANRAGLDQAADILFQMLQASTVYTPEIQQAITTLYASKLDFVADQVIPLVFGGSIHPEQLKQPAYYIDSNLLSHPSQRFSLDQIKHDYILRIQSLFKGIHQDNEASNHLVNLVAAMVAWHVEPIRLFMHPSITKRTLNYAQFLELNVQAQLVKQLDYNFADMTYQELMLLGQTMTVEQPIVLDLLMQQIHNNMPADTTFWPSFACEDTGKDLHTQAQCYANEIHYVWGLKEHLDKSREIVNVQLSITESSKDASFYTKLAEDCRTHQTHWICHLDMSKNRDLFLKKLQRMSAAGLLESHLKMHLTETYHLNLDELQFAQDKGWFRWQMRTCGYYWASITKLCTSSSVLSVYDIALLRPTHGFFYIFPHPRTGHLIYLKVSLAKGKSGKNELQWQEIDAAQMDNLQSDFFSESFPGLTKQIPIWDSTKLLRHGFMKLFLQDELLKQEMRQHQNPHVRYEVKHVWEHFIPFYDAYIDVLNGDYGMLTLDTAVSIFVVATAGVGEAVDASAVAVREVGVAVEAISEKIAAGEALSQTEHVTFHEGVNALRYAGTSIGKAALRMVDPGVEMVYHIGSGVGRFGVYSIKGIRNFAKSLTSRLARDVPACVSGAVRHRRSADSEEVVAACALLRRRLGNFTEDSEAVFGESQRSSGYSSRRSSLHLVELPSDDIKVRLDAMRAPLTLIEHLDTEWKTLSYGSFIKADAGIHDALQVNKVVEKGAYTMQPHPLLDVLNDRPISNVFQDAYHNKFIQIKGEFYRVKMVLPASLDKMTHVTGDYGDALFFLRQENYAMKDFYEVSYNVESEAWDVTGELYSDVMQEEEVATKADEVSYIMDLNNGLHIDEMSTEISRVDVKSLLNSDELHFNADFGAKIESATSKGSSAVKEGSAVKSNVLEEPVSGAHEFSDVEDGFTSSIETDTASSTTTSSASTTASSTTTSSIPPLPSEPELENTLESIQEIEDMETEEVSKLSSRRALTAGKRHHTLGKHIRISKAELLKRVGQTKATQASLFGMHVEQDALSNLNHYRREIFAEDVIYRALNHQFDLLKTLTKVGSKQSLNSLTATENALLKSHGYLNSGIKEDLLIGQKFVLRHTFDEATGIKVLQSGEVSDTHTVTIVMEYVKETEFWKIITAFTE
jgi:hypothetical protein